MDYLIRGGQVIDGGGGAGFFADIAIDGGKIAAMGDLRQLTAAQTIDATGRYVTPGFLDLHRHGDGALFRPGFGEAELHQGLTTVVNGNCGLSLAPCGGGHRAEILRYLAPILGDPPPSLHTGTLGDYLGAAAGHGTPLHVGTLVGMGGLRAQVAGFGDGALSDSQLYALHGALETALSDGALGVSLGLGYAPECFYDTAGLLRALAPLQNSGIPLAVHLRQEGSGVLGALREMLTVARALGTPVEISHLKCIGGEKNPACVPELLRLLQQARDDGVDVACDVYPYTAGSTQLLHVLPPDCQQDGTEELLRRLGDGDYRAFLRRRMETGEDFENIVLLAGFENIVASALSAPENRPYAGLSIAEIARRTGRDGFTCLFDLLVSERLGAGMIDTIAAEGDVEQILRAPFSAVISDSTYPTSGGLHPRVYGTFPRLLETYVREKAVLTMEEAIHKITGLPAARYGLSGRGRLAVGAVADVNVFALERIHETATYAAPAQLAQGMDWVFVAGQPAIADGQYIGGRAGQILRRGTGASYAAF
ncbi:MAG: amidohydrolase family protein [Oscillospiraceae bacterium]